MMIITLNCFNYPQVRVEIRDRVGGTFSASIVRRNFQAAGGLAEGPWMGYYSGVAKLNATHEG